MKKLKKREIAVLALLLAFVLAGVGVIIGVVRHYRSAPFGETFSLAGEYHYNGKLFFSEDGKSAYAFSSLGRDGFGNAIPRTVVDLTPFGFEGKKYEYFKTSYFVSDGYNRIEIIYALNPAEGYEGFWPVSDPTRFVYLAEDGKKYAILPENKICYPLFAQSSAEVDEYARDVVAFSAHGSYAIGLDGQTVRIYLTDPHDTSYRITEVKEISLADYGTVLSFGGFVGDTQAYLIVKAPDGREAYVAVDCALGKVAASALKSEGDYAECAGRMYIRRLQTEQEEGAEGKRLIWCHRLLGTEKSAPLPEELGDVTLHAVSASASYAVAAVGGEEKREYVVFSEKKSAPLSAVLAEGETVEWIDFAYENVLAVSVRLPDGESVLRAYKIRF